MQVGKPVANVLLNYINVRSIYFLKSSKILFYCQRDLFNTNLRFNLPYKDPIQSVSNFKTKKYENKRVNSKSFYEKLIQFRVLTIPNVLTGVRILLTPVLSYLVVYEYYKLACSCFAVAGLTDLLDGYIARTYPSQMSDLGSYIDPLADKFLISSLFITLTYVHLIPVALMSLVVARDIILAGAGFYTRYVSLDPRPISLKEYFDPSIRSVALRPTFVSKINTALQLCLVGITMGAPIFSYIDHPSLHALWYFTGFMTLTSGMSYIFAKDTIKIVKQRKKKTHKTS